MYCTKCGSPCYVDDRFCAKCGSALDGAQVAPFPYGGKPELQVQTVEPTEPAQKNVAAASWSQTPAYDPFALTPESEQPGVGTNYASLPRPWIRYWAKIVDIYVAAIVFGFLFGMVLPEMLVQNDVVLGILFLFCWTLLEPLVLACFGTTVGRGLMNFNIVARNGLRVPLARLYQRSFRVWFAGMGLGLPIVSLVTYIMSYNDLEKNRQSAWDRDLGTQVLHGRVSAWRVVVLVLLLAGFIGLVVLDTVARYGAY